MMRNQILKIYLSNFLLGLVFWYGIEKLFMINIGISAVGVGLVASFYALFTLVFDIPAGILADKWSRKGVLAISVASMAVGSVIMGVSNGLPMYLLGYVFYGIFIVTRGGTCQAIVYDILHESGQHSQYSRIMGRARAFSLLGTALANVASGFLAVHFSYSSAFMLTVIPCALNVVLILSIVEPRFHKEENKEKVLRQLGVSFNALIKTRLLRALTIVMTVFAVIEMVRGGFGQLYILRYVPVPQLIGLLWATSAICRAIGNVIAHRLHNHLSALMVLSTLPLVLMSFVDSWMGVIFFMVLTVASSAMLNQIETRVQDNTPSAVRTSILSVLSSISSGVMIPCGLLIGWLIKDYDILWAFRSVAILATLVAIYWFASKYKNEQRSSVNG